MMGYGGGGYGGWDSSRSSGYGGWDPSRSSGYGGYSQTGQSAAYGSSGYGSAWGAPAQQAQTQPAAAAGAGGDLGVGTDATTLIVRGCAHASVGPTIRGTYLRTGENHGKPAFKRDAQVNGLDVMIYFWDERDGTPFSGWWFGPAIGGDQVWAYHPNKQCTSPPATGWKVPYDGPVDNTLVLTGQGGASASAARGWSPAAQATPQVQRPPQQWGTRPLGQQGAAFNSAYGWGHQGAQQPDAENELQRKQQQEAMRKRIEEKKFAQEVNRKKLEEANKKRIEEQQKKMQDLRAKQETDRKQKEQELINKREEQRAAMAVRKVIQKVRAATEEDIDELEKELEEEQEKELDNCGELKEKVKKEAEQSLEGAKKRIEQVVEQRKKEEQARAKAEELMKEFEGVVEEAEAAKSTLVEKAEALKAENDLTADEVASAVADLEEAAEEARERQKACMDFLTVNGAAIRGPPPAPGATSPAITQLPKLTTRVNNNKQAVEQTLTAAKVSQAVQTKKAEAKKKLAQVTARFDKYDTDKDGILLKKDIVRLAKGLYDFAVPAESQEHIWRVLVKDGAKGVARGDFHRLQVAIGVAREKVMDAELREQRLARERELADMKEALQERVRDAAGPVDAAVERATEAEEQTKPPPPQGPDVKAGDLTAQADSSEQLLKAAKEALATAKKQLEELKEGVDAELKAYILNETSRLEIRLRPLDGKITKVSGILGRLREQAKRLDLQELNELRHRTLAVIRYHQLSKKLKSAEVFDAMNTSKSGRISEEEFLEFFETCDKDGEAKADDSACPSSEDIARLFKSLVDEGENLAKEEFLRFIRLYMKVVKDTVITDTISIKESKTVRRLEVGEVVEVLQGPLKEGTVEVFRIHAQAMKDGQTGWITTAGNQGTRFLEDGGSDFKVVKETILTDSFDIAEGAKASTRKLKDTTRKLRPGELVEALEWPRKESTGVMRMQCRVKSDGSVGWATSVGNSGIVFLELV